jgi:hypothetical protein
MDKQIFRHTHYIMYVAKASRFKFRFATFVFRYKNARAVSEVLLIII